MAFNPNRMSSLSCSGDFGVWHYRSSEDTLETIGTPGYFEMRLPLYGCAVYVTDKDGRTDQIIIPPDTSF